MAGPEVVDRRPDQLLPGVSLRSSSGAHSNGSTNPSFLPFSNLAQPNPTYRPVHSNELCPDCGARQRKRKSRSSGAVSLGRHMVILIDKRRFTAITQSKRSRREHWDVRRDRGRHTGDVRASPRSFKVEALLKAIPKVRGTIGPLGLWYGGYPRAAVDEGRICQPLGNSCANREQADQKKLGVEALATSPTVVPLWPPGESKPVEPR
jgi:hypothetical protein